MSKISKHINRYNEIPWISRIFLFPKVYFSKLLEKLNWHWFYTSEANNDLFSSKRYAKYMSC